MNKRILVYGLALLVVTGSAGALSASAHGWGFRQGEGLFTQAEVEARIAEKVAEGTITQEQADRRFEHMADMEERRAAMDTQRDEHLTDLASFLGLSVDDLKAQIESGLRINEIAEAQGISEEVFDEYHQAQMIEHQTERLQALVNDGKLTQEEADEKLAQIEAGDFPGPMMGKGGRRGGHEGMGTGERRGFGF